MTFSGNQMIATVTNKKQSMIDAILNLKRINRRFKGAVD